MESEEFAFHFGMQRQSAKYYFREINPDNWSGNWKAAQIVAIVVGV